jgi:hypothetical protein
MSMTTNTRSPDDGKEANLDLLSILYMHYQVALSFQPIHCFLLARFFSIFSSSMSIRLKLQLFQKGGYRNGRRSKRLSSGANHTHQFALTHTHPTHQILLTVVIAVESRRQGSHLVTYFTISPAPIFRTQEPPVQDSRGRTYG